MFGSLFLLSASHQPASCRRSFAFLSIRSISITHFATAPLDTSERPLIAVPARTLLTALAALKLAGHEGTFALSLSHQSVFLRFQPVVAEGRRKFLGFVKCDGTRAFSLPTNNPQTLICRRTAHAIHFRTVPSTLPWASTTAQNACLGTSSFYVSLIVVSSRSERLCSRCICSSDSCYYSTSAAACRQCDQAWLSRAPYVIVAAVIVVVLVLVAAYNSSKPNPNVIKHEQGSVFQGTMQLIFFLVVHKCVQARKL